MSSGERSARPALSHPEFVSAVRAGRGSAVLDLRAHSEIDRTDAFVEACLRDGVYDHQCEGSRAPWVLEMLVESGHVARVAPRVAAGLADVLDDGFHLPHSLEHLVGFARHDAGESRAAVIAALDAPRIGFRFELARAAVEIGGREQLRAALRCFAVQPAAWILGDAVDWQRELVLAHGIDALERARRAAPLGDERLERRAYVLWTWMDARRRAEDAGVPPSEWPTLEYDDDPEEESVPSLGLRGIATRPFDALTWSPRTSDDALWPDWVRAHAWGKETPVAELERAYSAIEGAKDVTRLELLLTVFRRRDLPRVEDHVLALAEHENERVTLAAATALGRITDERVHALALRRIARGIGDEATANLLAKNWKRGDAERLARVLPTAPERKLAHALGFDLAHDGPPLDDAGAVDVYAWVYSHTPCSNCRERAVTKLHRAGCMPDWMRAEIAHDVDEDVRALASA